MGATSPVTQNEYVVRDGALIVSATDAEGRIVLVSPEFIQVSGYSAEELMGNNHGVLRHPDTPAVVYEDLWKTLRAGRPWSGLIKNRRKNGDYYWDIANATPLREGGAISGYMTVRTKPSAHQIREAEQLYRRLADRSDKSLTFCEGIVRRQHWSHAFNPLRRMSDQGKRWLDTAAGVTVLLVAALLLLAPDFGGLDAARRGRSASWGCAACCG